VPNWAVFAADIRSINAGVLPKMVRNDRGAARWPRPALPANPFGDRMPAPEEHASPPPTPGVGMTLLAAADLQDHLMVASNDLERLQRLLSDACDSLMLHFHGANGELRTLLDDGAERPGPGAAAAPPEQLGRVMQHMAGAITAMQFQDMASQLVAHTTKRLRNCADRLASQTMGDDEDGCAVIEEAPLRPNPVTQDEMDAGSIELF
jgi:hypothetical protein